MDDIHTQLRSLLVEAKEKIPTAQDLGTLEVLELHFLGRKQGAITALLRGIGGLPPEQRKQMGAQMNEAKAVIESLIRERRAALEQSRTANLSDTEWVDVTAPGVRPPGGSVHPISQAIRDITAI